MGFTNKTELLVEEMSRREEEFKEDTEEND